MYRERVSKRILLKHMSQVKYTYTNLRGVTRVSTFLGTQSQPSLEHQFLPFCLESNQLKGQLWPELSSFQHVTSKQNVPQECWLKITRKCLECCFKFQFWYIKQQSDKIIFQEKNQCSNFFLQVLVAISVVLKLPMLQIRHILHYCDYLRSAHLSSTKLCMKHMPMDFL